MKKFLISAIIFLIASPAWAFNVNDPLVQEQWYLNHLGVQDAWDVTLGKDEVVVAVIDTGVDLNHPDINYWRNSDEKPGDGIDNDQNGYIDDYRGWDFVDEDSDPMPYANGLTDDQMTIIHHGTIISGIIGAIPNNNEGVAGISWKTQIMPLRIASLDGYTDTLKVANAIQYAVDNGADVINMSFVSIDEVNDTHLQDKLKYAYDNNVMVVAAAGNGNQGVGVGININENNVYPVCYYDNFGTKLAIGVAGLDRNDIKTEFSNYGSVCIEVSAPAVDIFSSHFYQEGHPKLNSHYGGYWAGTSFAAPMVTGAAAYLKSIDKNISVDEQFKLIQETGDDIDLKNPEFAGHLGKRLNIGRLITQFATEKGIEVQEIPLPVEPEEPSVPIIEIKLEVPTQNFPQSPLKYYTAPFKSGEPEITIFDKDLNVEHSFLAYNKWVTDGLRFEVVNAYNYGLDAIITAPSKGASPWIRIFSTQGILRNEFLAYDYRFTGGVRVAFGDVDGDGLGEIITAPQSGGGPHVRVFDQLGNLESEFFAYSKDDRKGLSLATGDVNGDGIDEIIVGLGAGNQPMVRVFDNNGNLENEFLAYNSNFTGGIEVASGDIHGDGLDEVFTSPGPGGGPHIKIFNGNGNLIKQFFSYDKGFSGGVNITEVDYNNDNKSEIMVSPQGNGGPHVRIFDSNGNVVKQFFPYDKDFRGGVVVRAN